MNDLKDQKQQPTESGQVSVDTIVNLLCEVVDLLKSIDNKLDGKEYDDLLNMDAYSALLSVPTVGSRIQSSPWRGDDINKKVLKAMKVKDFLNTDNRSLSKMLYQVGIVSIEKSKKEINKRIQEG